ncbi:hypothetical protein AK812_SmicGene2115 [Symbiodinium microadriaticum]|uniref:Uncharacterized protein n=1 Tax=Symbiodinium microadriaticum TaxID=2951 RepID=A0A1Q9F2L6_SYMMI|nr:hypothetical protein AK812_SmicGene2115 [Symbiodinium microadriaticum]
MAQLHTQGMEICHKAGSPEALSRDCMPRGSWREDPCFMTDVSSVAMQRRRGLVLVCESTSTSLVGLMDVPAVR